MQRAEDQVAGFGCPQGRLDGFQVAQLADKDHVRVHSQRSSQGLGEAGDVGADFTLVDHRLLVGVVVFDGIFDGDDVLVEVLIDVVDHRRQRGGLSRAGRSGDQEHAARAATQAGDDGRQADLLERQQLRRDQPQRDGDVAFLLKDGRSKAAGLAELKAEVRAALFLQLLLAAVGSDGSHELDGVFGIEDLGFQRAQAAVQPQRRRAPHVQVQVAGAFLDAGLEETVDKDVVGHGGSRGVSLRW